ncbi:unnamed protein product [Prunus armeniaca]
MTVAMAMGRWVFALTAPSFLANHNSKSQLCSIALACISLASASQNKCSKSEFLSSPVHHRTNDL